MVKKKREISIYEPSLGGILKYDEDNKEKQRWKIELKNKTFKANATILYSFIFLHSLNDCVDDCLLLIGAQNLIKLVVGVVYLTSKAQVFRVYPSFSLQHKLE